jgi:hypothetical protein
VRVSRRRALATSPQFVPPEEAKEALSQYARQQQLKWFFSQLTAGQKGQALQQLLFDHFAGLPKSLLKNPATAGVVSVKS